MAKNNLDNNIITTKDIIKIYYKGKLEIRALNGVSIEIQRGAFISIMGASGSGKSTLLHIIGALDKPTSGEVFLEGKNLAILSDDDLSDFRRQRVGFIFQQFNLLPTLSAFENAALPLLLNGITNKKDMKRVEQLLKKVGIGHRLQHKPEELSGGEIQRVAIARALIMKPAIILADEPTGNLDSKTELEILNLLEACHQDFSQTIIMVTHDKDISSIAQKTLFLKDGRIITE